MATLLQLLVFIFFCLLLCSSVSSNQIPKVYIVYMGSSSNEFVGVDDQSLRTQHLEMLSSVIPTDESGRVSLIHHYKNAFKGFSALLTEDEASVLSGYAGVVSVFEDPMLELHTTRSWDFLDSKSNINTTHFFHQHHPSSDVIIGIIDSGIWPESPSFSDQGIGKIPSRWKGTCMEGPDFKKSNCNRKLIGARYYDIVTENTALSNGTILSRPIRSPRDNEGHGTHTASTAAGALVRNVSYHGLALGTARGGSPSSRLAIYKVCSSNGCPGCAMLQAIDDAVADGVDILSISIGSQSKLQTDYLSNPIAFGAFHAEEKGVLVVCSAGNKGPVPYSVVNSAPWIFTVAASSIDRDFQSTVILGNGKTFKGSAINFPKHTSTRTYPLVFGEEAAAKLTPVSEARNCYPESIDRRKVAGKIVVCNNSEDDLSILKLLVEDAGAKGMILIRKEPTGNPFDSGAFPFSEIGHKAGIQALKYMNSTKEPTARILPAVAINQFKPAPSVAYFSSRGPGEFTENILKPDIMAPGVAILAAMIPEGKGRPSEYALMSGTSMACPHVSGAVAFIKSTRRGWTSSMIKSALMTTASISNNMEKPFTNSSHQLSNPHEFGVGEIDPIKALNPGLVFETTTDDYLRFLCHFGSPAEKIRYVSKANSFKCPEIRGKQFISNINYPSISISKLHRNKPPKSIKRTVTNIGSTNATYIASVHAPVGLAVKVLPRKIVFSKDLTRVSFKVAFSGKNAPEGYSFGYVTWVDGRHSVRLWFAVNVK